MLDLSLRAIILPAADIETRAKGAALGPENHHPHIEALLQPAKIILQREDHVFVHVLSLSGRLSVNISIAPRCSMWMELVIWRS